MRRIAIQSGHWGMTTGATGAPREQERTIAIGRALVDLLNRSGFEAVWCNAFANTNPAIVDKDWDLFLALHCDANYAGDEGGGFFDWIDLSIDSSLESNIESKRIMDALISVYFPETGIRNVEARRNPNTKFYYMWDALSAKTSCVIVEMGESIDPHDNVLLNDTNRIVNALFHGIRKAFGTQTVPVPPPQSTDEKDKLIAQLKEENHVKDIAITGKDELIHGMTLEYEQLAVKLTECQNKPDNSLELNTKLVALKAKYNKLLKMPSKKQLDLLLNICEKLEIQV